jgi:hypothetical protein
MVSLNCGSIVRTTYIVASCWDLPRHCSEQLFSAGPQLHIEYWLCLFASKSTWTSEAESMGLGWGPPFSVAPPYSHCDMTQSHLFYAVVSNIVRVYH